MAFLPMNIKEVKARGWDEVDFVYAMGDSYVDHPSFGAAIITRVLDKEIPLAADQAETIHYLNPSFPLVCSPQNLVIF